MSGIELPIAAAAAAGALLIGYFLGSRREMKRIKTKNGQKLTPNELQRWKLDHQYTTILMEKNPVSVAEDHLNKLNENMDRTKQELSALSDEVSEELKNLDKLRGEVVAQSNKVSKQLVVETKITPWFANIARLREKAETHNNILVGHEMQRRFLDIVRSGRTKPGLVDLMDKTAIDLEKNNPFRKSFSLMESQMKALDKLPETFMADLGLDLE